MPLPKEVQQSLSYLRRKYKVSERDLVGLARKLQKEEEPTESWEQITKNYIEQRKRRIRNAHTNKTLP
jgi:hypothetical protein